MAKKAPNRMFTIIAVALAVVVVGGFTLSEVLSARREAAETARMLTVDGPVCPTTKHATAPARRTVYEGVAFSRQVAGQVNCNTLQEDGAAVPVCMFIGPGALRVTTEQGTFDYAPGAGAPATVYVRDGKPECVLAVNQALFAVGAAR